MNTKEPIRIAQIIGKWVGGGVEAVVMNYYRHIDRSKVQFDFFCDADSTDIPYEEIKSLGGKVIIIPPYQKVFKYQRELKRLLKEGNYKIVHSHINTLSVFPLRAAKKAGVPVRIAHSHSTSNKKEWKRNIIKHILRRFSRVYATDYFACSEAAGRFQFGNKTFEAGKVRIINNAIDIDKFKFNEKTRNEKRKALGIKEDTLVIGHVGRFVQTKNHSFLIDVFNEVHKKNNNSVLILVGQGPLRKSIESKVHDLGLLDSVLFLGQRNDVNELYQAMDVFVLPSLYEGLGMVLIEAQASGLQCVVSTEVPEIVNINNTTFIDLNKNIEEWVNLINSNSIHRNIDLNIITKKGYDIKSESLKLQDYYINYGEHHEK